MATQVTAADKGGFGRTAVQATPAPRTSSGFYLAVSAALLLLLGSVIVGTSLGASPVPLRVIMASLAGKRNALSPAEQTILLQVRLPRVFTAGVIGAALSLAGVLFQGLFRNPMAEPYVLGTSGGAAIGAAFGIFLFPQSSILGFSTTASFAFVGSIVIIFFVYALARVGGRTPIVPLLLSGLAVSMVLNEVSSLLIYLREELSWNARNLALWLQGSIAVAEWPQLIYASGMLLMGVVLCIPLRSVLNAFALGEEYAQLVGIKVELARTAVIIIASLLTAAAVLLGGIIPFVGLVVPHIVRLIAGPEHGRLLVFSAIGGACYLILADAFSRTIIAPSELPVGIVTAFLGGPVLLYLLRRSKREYVL